MKVKDLKIILEQLDPELEIIVDGYEGGANSLKEENVGTVKAYLNFRKPTYFGPHEPLMDYTELNDDLVIEEVLLLSRSKLSDYDYLDFNALNKL